jgi:6-phosphogluconolactonase
MDRQIIRTKDFVREAAGLILDAARQALAQRGEFRIALSGGNTPRPVYGEVAQAGRDLPWNKVLITFGDERCVPPEDPQSNYRMARESLFDPGGIPAESILRMRGEIEPETAAREYEARLTALATARGEKIYGHDLILLGMGDDGHTASLFPGTTALAETDRWVVSNFVPKFNACRLTFTLPLLNEGRHVCFLVNAGKHADLIEQVLRGDVRYPAARIQPVSGKLTWILGQAA